MRKSTKLAALVAGLVALCAMTAIAGWVPEGGAWYYTDKNGDYVTSAWKADGANYYWLDEDGVMATNALIEDGEYTYWVGADGARVANTWVAVEADDADIDLDVDHRWYYFQANGKAYKNKTATINGQKYHFDENGKMVFGYVDANCEIINDYEDKPLEAVYYYGDNDDGAMFTGWKLYTEGFTTTDDYDGLSEVWFYFSKKAANKGQKLVSKTEKIDGKNYIFDAKGVMKSEWVEVTDATPAAASTSEYFSADVDGHLVKNEWIYKIPSEAINPKDNEEENYRWFRANKKGELLRYTTSKINGKYYTFDDDAIMKSGLQFMEFVGDDDKSSSPTNYVVTGDAVNYTSVTKKLDDKIDLFYFSGDEKADGSMKTGTYKIEVSDETYTFTFDSHGRAIKGVYKNKVYVNGMQLTAGDMRYAVVDDVYAAAGEQDTYLVSTTGTIISGKKYVKDADDDYYATFVDEKGVQSCYKFKDSDDAAKYAKDFTKNGAASEYAKFGTPQF